MNVQWSMPGEPWRQPKPLFSRMVSALSWVVCGLAALAVYTNVMADDSALQERTNALARRHAGCDDRCRVTRMSGQRSVLEYRTEIEIDGVGTIHIVCRRRAIVAGEHDCSVR